MNEYIPQLDNTSLASHASFMQGISAGDFRIQQTFNERDPSRAIWQQYHADASAALFELIERNGK